MAGGIIAGLSAFSGLMTAVGGVPAAAHEIGSLIDRFVPDPNQKAAAAAEVQKLLVAERIATAQAASEFAKAQAALNLTDAQSQSLFRSGWRPALGWGAGAALLYAMIAQPLLAWAVGILSVMIGANLPAPPSVEVAPILGLLATLMGLGGLRTIEKTKGVAT